MTLELTNDELLSATRSVRLRLDFDRVVPHDVLTDRLRVALQAPSASDAQDWQWIFVDEAERKVALADI